MLGRARKQPPPGRPQETAEAVGHCSQRFIGLCSVAQAKAMQHFPAFKRDLSAVVAILSRAHVVRDLHAVAGRFRECWSLHALLFKGREGDEWDGCDD
eukprot:8254632-Alexandrium_andersonii.AAC.1